MKPRVAIALCLLLSLGGSSLAAEPPPSEGETLEDSGAAKGTADPSAASPEDQNTDPSPAAEPPGKDSPAMDVHRHRPGACPEGPPCKGDD
jgi:hypothetical protein